MGLPSNEGNSDFLARPAPEGQEAFDDERLEEDEPVAAIVWEGPGEWDFGILDEVRPSQLLAFADEQERRAARGEAMLSGGEIPNLPHYRQAVKRMRRIAHRVRAAVESGTVTAQLIEEMRDQGLWKQLSEDSIFGGTVVMVKPPSFGPGKLRPFAVDVVTPRYVGLRVVCVGRAPRQRRTTHRSCRSPGRQSEGEPDEHVVCRLPAGVRG